MSGKNRFDLELKHNEPAQIPAPASCDYAITDIVAEEGQKGPIYLDLMVQIIRIDTISGDDDEIAEPEVVSQRIATIYPEVNSHVSVFIPFTQFNMASVRALGGNLHLYGVTEEKNIEGLEELASFE